MNCNEDRNFTELLKIYPVGINEALSIELDVVCQCSCEESQLVRHHFGMWLLKEVIVSWNSYRFQFPGSKRGGDGAQLCLGNGREKCGVCECDHGYSGLKCECNERNVTLTTNNKSCIRPDAQDQQDDCSGRGTCRCGVCHCHPPASKKDSVWGRYCECDNYSCPFGNQQICSGPDHGDCHCGICQCRPGWQVLNLLFSCACLQYSSSFSSFLFPWLHNGMVMIQFYQLLLFLD